jgi:hypothetical protein
VTASQRTRLILSLGVLNLFLASIALGIGGVELQQRAEASAGPVAQVPPTPTSTLAPTTAPETQGPASPSPASPSEAPPTASPPEASAAPSIEPSPSASPSPVIGSPSPGSGTPAGNAAPTLAPAAPTPAATPQVTPAPTPRVTPAPTPRPVQATPKPTPKPKPHPKPPKAAKVKAPCPSDGAPPPGRNKGAESGDRPCSGGKGKSDSGVIFVLPLLASTAAWSARPERLRRRRLGR